MGNSKTKPEKCDSTETNENTTSIYPQLQIRNCIRNVRNNSSTFSDMYPNEAGTSCGQTQSSVFTIDGNSAIQTNFTNSAYVSTEGTAKTSTSNDGLPSYEEAIGVTVKGPIASQSIPTIEVVNEDVSRDVDDSGGGGGSGVGGASTGCSGRRHRHRRHHHRLNSDRHNENSEPNATEGESRRNRHRRGFRKHLAKIKRRHHTETE